MNRSLSDIASELGQVRQLKAQTELLKWQAGKDMEARLVEMTPVEGWPGKNAEQREDAKRKAIAEDNAYQVASDQANMATSALFEIDAQLAALEDERRAAEWEIRLRQVETLAAMIQNDHRSQDGQLFDGVVQNEVDEQALGQPVDYSEFKSPPPRATYQMLAPEPDEIPF